MNDHKIIVVGGGISGLYICYQLLKKGYSNITLIEKNNVFGGRMLSQKINLPDNTSVSIEGGAGVIRSTDKLMVNLLNDLNIKTDFWLPSPTPLIYIDDQGTKLISYGSKQLLNKVCKNATSNQSLIELVNGTNISEEEKITFLIGTSYGELFNSNSLNTCVENNWDEFLFVDHQYGKPKEWSMLTNELVNTIKDKTNLLLDEELIKVTPKFILTLSSKIAYDTIIFTPPINQLQKIKFTKEYNLWFNEMNKLQFQIDYLRVYCLLENPINFKSKICTNLDIRRIIPISDRIIMGVYTDGDDALKIHEKIIQSKEESIIYIEDQLQHLIGKVKILQIWEHFWSNGICGWYPTDKPLEEYLRYINHPLDNVYFCGDGYSLHTGWLEGALESCENILSNF